MLSVYTRHSDDCKHYAPADTWVAADLKIRLIFSTPGQPQGRGRIERFFRTVNDMFLCSLDGYQGKK
jgi:transposase InsO family protein